MTCFTSEITGCTRGIVVAIAIVIAFLVYPALAAAQEPVGEAVEVEGTKVGDSAEEASDSISKPAAQLPGMKINPVDIDREKPRQPVMHYYDKHGDPLETPVRFLTELDTVVKVKSGPKFKAFNGVSIGGNFFDAIMMLVGQRRANFDVWADCSIHNWFFPVVEMGVGFSDARPNDGRFHFKVAPSFFARIGMNYNFLYKSNPDYQVYLGLRAGMSHFGYDITNISAGSDYYTEGGPKQMMGLTSTAFYGQVLAGLKVKLWRFISMGWSVRYGFMFKQKFSDPDYPAWFTPGHGTSSPISSTFSLIFTIGSPKEKNAAEAEAK